MVDIFEGVLLAMDHANGVNPNPFQKGKPEEIIIYKGTNAFDELIPRLKDVASKHCPEILIQEEASKEGYSSVHLVTRLNAHPKHPPSKGYKIPIEIQIRSVFEDAWGEIDHKYGYVIRSGKNIGKPINNPEFVLAHLKVLKRFTDGCMEYADAIQTEAIGIPSSLLAPSKVVSVVSDNLILERFKQLNVDEKFIEKYRKIREVKDDASSRMESNVEEAKNLYLNAAEQFREIEALIDKESSQGGNLAYYYIKMNEALCLMSTNERDQVVAAHGIYQTLVSGYPEFPLVKMRYGQVLGKLGHLDLAIEKLREAGASAKDLAHDYLGKEPAQWPDELPYTDYDHIVHTQPKMLGYNIWLKIRTLGPKEEAEKCKLFMDAYDITLHGLENVEHSIKQKLSISNNLLYYATGAFTRSGLKSNGRTIDPKLLRKRIVEHVAYIEENIGAEYKTSTVDTLMKAYSILGDKQKAIKYANLLIDKCLDKEESELDSNEKIKMVRIAHQIIKGEDITIID